MKAMRILVYGAGVQGSLYASRLAESGHDVALLARGARLAELRARGILLEDILTGRTTTTVVPIVDRLEPGDAFDLVLIPVRREQIAAVGKLNDVPNLVPVLQALGAKHSTMGQEGNRIVKAHYDLVGQQLMVSHNR